MKKTFTKEDVKNLVDYLDQVLILFAKISENSIPLQNVIKHSYFILKLLLNHLDKEVFQDIPTEKPNYSDSILYSINVILNINFFLLDINTLLTNALNNKIDFKLFKTEFVEKEYYIMSNYIHLVLMYSNTKLYNTDSTYKSTIDCILSLVVSYYTSLQMISKKNSKLITTEHLSNCYRFVNLGRTLTGDSKTFEYNIIKGMLESYFPLYVTCKRDIDAAERILALKEEKV